MTFSSQTSRLSSTFRRLIFAEPSLLYQRCKVSIGSQHKIAINSGIFNRLAVDRPLEIWPDNHERNAKFSEQNMGKLSAAVELGRRGGTQRAKNLTKAQRVAGARKAGLASGKARRAKAKKGAKK